jgi:hypothetical protein
MPPPFTPAAAPHPRPLCPLPPPPRRRTGSSRATSTTPPAVPWHTIPRIRVPPYPPTPLPTQSLARIIARPAAVGPAADRPSAAGAALDARHSHLILVDDGSAGQFGREIEFRGHFEAHVRQPRGAGDEDFIVETMRDLGIGWEGSAEAGPPTHARARRSPPSTPRAG